MSDLEWVTSDGRAVCCAAHTDEDCTSDFAAFDLKINAAWHGHSACGNPAHMQFVAEMKSVAERLTEATS